MIKKMIGANYPKGDVKNLSWIETIKIDSGFDVLFWKYS